MTNLSKISNEISESSAAFIEIDEASEGQRIDNFLTKTLKGVPKSHLYRILRSGEVRVNKKRIDATYKLAAGDLVRVPRKLWSGASRPRRKSADRGGPCRGGAAEAQAGSERGSARFVSQNRAGAESRARDYDGPDVMGLGARVRIREAHGS